MDKPTEKQQRVYYQNIVYEVCNLLDAAGTGDSRLVCGTVNEASTEVQDALKALIRRRPAGRQSYKQDLVWLAMHQAVESFSGTGENDGVFNAAGFSAAMMRLAGLKGVIDGHLVYSILAGRTDVEILQGDAHYRLLGER